VKRSAIQHGDKMVNCPQCKKELTKPINEWDYAQFHVKLFHCSECDKNLKAYFREGKFSHTIPKVREE
jgi:uncharacterized CHY-type Zn-finger protein